MDHHTFAIKRARLKVLDAQRVRAGDAHDWNRFDALSREIRNTNAELQAILRTERKSPR